MTSRAATSTLVVDAVECAAAAVSEHFAFLTQSEKSIDKLAAAAAVLQFGYDCDLDDRVSENENFGFDHSAVSAIFRERFAEYSNNRDVGNFLTAADDDRHLYSFGTGARLAPPHPGDPTRPRTRASAIVQQALRESRNVKQKEKATTAREGGSPSIFIPSPFRIAFQLLSDPDSEPSRVYARAAVLELIRERLADAGRTPVLDYDALKDALSIIRGRVSTSKPVIASLSRNGPAVLWVCHYLAMNGQMVLQADSSADGAVRSLSTNPWPALLGIPESPAGSLSFWAHPQFETLPDISMLLNVANGLPLPIEGAGTIFCDGLRFAKDGAIVSSISGSFGTGKTSVCLSLAAALAPLGCRTLFLSCEEEQRDISNRLAEAAPDRIGSGPKLFSAVTPDDFGSRRKLENWFCASSLELSSDNETDFLSASSAACAIAELIEDAIEHAELFDVFRDETISLPSFARPVIVIDGLHQLISPNDDESVVEASLRKMVEACRGLQAVVIFTYSDGHPLLTRLDYLCDVVIELSREGFSNTDDYPFRILKLLKSRRQPTRAGAHKFHIHGPKGFRIKPRISARADEVSTVSWVGFSEGRVFSLTDATPKNFRRVSAVPDHSFPDEESHPLNSDSQILVTGRGSSGKAGFGLYMLHRRAFDLNELSDYRATAPEPGGLPDLTPTRPGNPRRLALETSGLPVRNKPAFYESRVLVVSFLYQDPYYQELTKRLPRGTARRKEESNYAGFGEVIAPGFDPHPDRLYTETLALDPGRISPEDLMAKMDARLTAADARGLPFTGVLIDGLHNIFVQFPLLEKDGAFWPELYSILRRRRVTVVTTHTKFSLEATGYHEEFPLQIATGRRMMSAASERTFFDNMRLLGDSLNVDFATAQRKTIPLLSALVSASDYVLDLSAVGGSDNRRYEVVVLTSLGVAMLGRHFNWNREKLFLTDIERTLFG